MNGRSSIDAGDCVDTWEALKEDAVDEETTRDGGDDLSS